jgi:hypothetical protein
MTALQCSFPSRQPLLTNRLILKGNGRGLSGLVPHDETARVPALGSSRRATWQTLDVPSVCWEQLKSCERERSL